MPTPNIFAIVSRVKVLKRIPSRKNTPYEKKNQKIEKTSSKETSTSTLLANRDRKQTQL